MRCLRALSLLDAGVDGVCGVLGVESSGDGTLSVGVGMARACVADADGGEVRIRFGVLTDVNEVVVSRASNAGALRFAPVEAGSLCGFEDGSCAFGVILSFMVVDTVCRASYDIQK